MDSLQSLIAGLLSLAGRFEDAGHRASASLLVGMAYGLREDPELEGGSHRLRAA